MRRRDIIAGGLFVAAAPALVRAQPVPVRVKLTTSAGVIVTEVYPDKAPITAGAFLRYVDQKRYDGAEIYRALKAQDDPLVGLVQGGLQNHQERKLAPIAHEPTTQTGLKHVEGTFSLARWEPGTATSEFFICIGESWYLDADPTQPGDNQGYAAFGQTIEGLDVAKSILSMPVSATEGGEMKGQILDPPVKILSAARIA